MAEILRAIEPDELAGLVSVGDLPRDMQEEACEALSEQLQLLHGITGNCEGAGTMLVNFPHNKVQAYLAYMTIPDDFILKYT